MTLGKSQTWQYWDGISENSLLEPVVGLYINSQSPGAIITTTWGGGGYYCLPMKNNGGFDTTTPCTGGMDVISGEAQRVSLGWAALFSQPLCWKTHPSAPALHDTNL